MYDAEDSRLIDTLIDPARRSETVKDRRRPGRRIHNVSPALIPLLRRPANAADGLIAGDLVPLDRFQIVAAWAASAYPADVWLRLSATERSAAISRELRKLDATYAAREASD